MAPSGSAVRRRGAVPAAVDPDDPAAAASGAPVPPGTRDRILDVALDLFTEKGFDKTSLREIASELGFSKAALYYHFASKEDILMALHLRLHEVGHEVLGRLRDQPPTPELWSALLEDFTVQTLSHQKLFLLHERNRAAFEQLHNEIHHGDHDDFEAQIRKALADETIALRDRVRMACALGAIMGGLLLAGNVFADVPPNQLTDLLLDAVRDLLDRDPVPR
jgi:AcrR family transcriptional regulator